MVMTIFWTKRAFIHLETELDYYGRINSNLAKELALSIKDAMANIANMPFYWYETIHTPPACQKLACVKTNLGSLLVLPINSGNTGWSPCSNISSFSIDIPAC